MPRLGLGTWKAEKGVVKQAVRDALELGYRAIDGACDYGNETEVGEGIKEAIQAGICKREDIFVTSKLWNTYHSRAHVLPALKKTLSDLGLEYLDLYLIHFPVSIKFVPFEERYPPGWTVDPKASHPKMELINVSIRETWEAMEELVDMGLVRNIGVSNFSCSLVMDLLKTCRIRPAVNQVELHPFLVQEHLVKWHQMAGVVVTAYSPLGGKSYVDIKLAKSEENLLDDPILTDIAKKHKVSTAQVVLRWHWQRGYTVIPKSSKKERLKENMDICTSFELSDDEMKKVASMDRNRRFNDPALYADSLGDFYPIFA